MRWIELAVVAKAPKQSRIDLVGVRPHNVLRAALNRVMLSQTLCSS